MAVKTYGHIEYTTHGDRPVWRIHHAQPHVWLKLKQLFPKIPQTAKTYDFYDSVQNCCDIEWMLSRYPMEITPEHFALLQRGAERYRQKVNDAEQILAQGYTPRPVNFKDGKAGRNYQLVARDLFDIEGSLLLGDDLGLGKTVVTLLCAMLPGHLPMLVVTPAGTLMQQWKNKIEEFTELSCYIIPDTKVKALPAVDVIIISYSKIAKWMNYFMENPPAFFVCEEAHELRRPGSQKYQACENIRDTVEYCLGLSATPIFNYGSEIWFVLNIIRPDCLGSYSDFVREWCTVVSDRKTVVNDPKALGAYLKESRVMLRRTKKDVNMETAAVNTIVEDVDYDEKAVIGVDELAKKLAMRTLDQSMSFHERGEAARLFDLTLRKYTGVSKASYVAAFVKMLLDSGTPVLLSGWHLDVYEIWEEEFKYYTPQFITGRETLRQKHLSLQNFTSGKSKLLIMSNRAAAGIDGLQYVCSTVVIGELDYSPKVHEQFIGRIDRPGQEEMVNVIYPVSDWGSDPPMVDLLALKSSQSNSIMNPDDTTIAEQHAEEGRVRALAQKYLNNINKTAW